MGVADEKIDELRDVVDSVREDLNKSFAYLSLKQRANDEKFENLEGAIKQFTTAINTLGEDFPSDTDKSDHIGLIKQLLEDDKKEEKEELLDEVAKIIRANKQEKAGKYIYIILVVVIVVQIFQFLLFKGLL